jgi:hypothetical protein
MSTPVRGPAGPLSYAPRWARSPASIDAHADRESTAEAMPAHDEIAEPPWRRDKSPAIFEGDIAIGAADAPARIEQLAQVGR